MRLALHDTVRMLRRRSARARRRARRREVILERLEDRVVLDGGGAQGSVLTYHYDQLRTGAETHETTLTPRNVATPDFGKLAGIKVDGQIYAQPLYVPNLKMGPGSRHDVVFVATETDKVYAIDADDPNAGPGHDGILWMRDYADPAHNVFPVRSADLSFGTITPNVGITGTPVIDPSTDTMYFVTFTEQPRGPSALVEYAAGVYTMELHAVDIATGRERQDPALIARTTIDSDGHQTYDTPLKVPGTGSASDDGVVPFTSSTMLQRPGLALDDNVPGHDGPVVFVGFGSSHDAEPYHGWLAGWDAKTLDLSSVINTSPNGYGASLWQAGGAPVVLPSGDIVITAGNGAFDATTTDSPGPNALGFADFGLGSAGIDHSAAVTFSTVIPHPYNNSTGLFFDGVVPGAQPLPENGTFLNIPGDSGVDFTTAHAMRVALDYDGSTLKEVITDTTTGQTFAHEYDDVDLPGRVGSDTAYIGFGGSTDARRATNEITGWTFSGGDSTQVDGFNGTDFTFNGTAQLTDSGRTAQLTTPTFDAVGSVFYNAPVPIGNFHTTFTFQMVPRGTTIIGDGISFIIQKSQGRQQPGSDYGDSMLRLSPTPGASPTGRMKVSDFFTPDEQQTLEFKDLDFGTAGTLVLPPPKGSKTPQTAIELAKTGELFVVNLDDMGHFGGPVQKITITNPETGQSLGLWGAMAFYNNTLYVHPANNVLQAFRFDPATQKFDPTPISVGDQVVGFPGDSVSVSANGGTHGIVWDLETDRFGRGPAVLRAYDANDLSLLYSSDVNPSDAAGPAVKFTVPVAVGGKVFVGTDGELDIYGLASPRGGQRGDHDGGSSPGLASEDRPSRGLSSASPSSPDPVPDDNLVAAPVDSHRIPPKDEPSPGLSPVSRPTLGPIPGEGPTPTPIPRGGPSSPAPIGQQLPALSSGGRSFLGVVPDDDLVAASIDGQPAAPNQEIIDELAQSLLIQKRPGHARR